MNFFYLLSIAFVVSTAFLLSLAELMAFQDSIRAPDPACCLPTAILSLALLKFLSGLLLITPKTRLIGGILILLGLNLTLVLLIKHGAMSLALLLMIPICLAAFACFVTVQRQYKSSYFL